MVKYINADRIENKYLLNVSISEFDGDFELIKSISAKKADIEKMTWILEDVILNAKNNSKKLDRFEIETNFNMERILSIFDNLSSLVC